ncbi:MAG TPA: VWA domain-containing protein [Opitutales bacterium]|nr:VWA domain-containing protein [Opitutales bacterium]
MNIEFQNPEYFWLLLALPLLLFLRGRAGRTAAVQFSSVAVARSVGASSRSRAGWLLFAFRALALGAFTVALARPQMPEAHSEQIDASGIDIVLVLDMSYSMASVDLSVGANTVTRVDAAKNVMQKFIEKRPNDRIGLVAFGTSPYLVSPITLNHEWLLQNLERLHLKVIDGGSTAIGSALGMAANRLRDIDSKSRVIILLTDGDNNAGNISPIAAAEAASAYKIKIYTVGVGSPDPQPMPLLDENGHIITDRFGRVQYNVDAFGRRAYLEGINSDDLQKIADKTAGKYYRATDENQLEKIYDEIDQMEKTTAHLRHYSTYQELFYWPALVGLVLVGLEQILAHTRLRRLP